MTIRINVFLLGSTILIRFITTPLIMKNFNIVVLQVEAKRAKECEYIVAKSAPVPNMPEIEVILESNLFSYLITGCKISLSIYTSMICGVATTMMMFFY